MSLGRCMFLLLFVCCIHPYEFTPLDDYVHADDPHFSWDVIKIYNELEFKIYVLNFTSQKWLDETFSTRPIWWHYLSIVVPNKITRPNSGLLFIDGGTNDQSPPKPLDLFLDFTIELAIGSGSIASYLQQIPNVPIRYMPDPLNITRSEDLALGWSWDYFVINGSNPNVNMLFPMTKASVRALDVIQQFTKNLSIPTPQKFGLTGASKRGWTSILIIFFLRKIISSAYKYLLLAWLAAAVDNQRVIAAMPIVMDLLKFQYNLHHHYRVLKGWSLALLPYYQCNITRYLDKPNMNILASYMDPYSYLDRYTKMKILQLQTTDAYWKDLQKATGGSYLRRLPNTDHSCLGHFQKIIQTIKSFYISTYENKSLPSVQWIKTINNTHGSIRVMVDLTNGNKPSNVFVYHSKTLDDKRRDFRLLVADPNNPDKPWPHPVFWYTEASVIESQNSTMIVYSFTMEIPSSGWNAFFFELSFSGPDGSVLDLTSETLVIPDTFPSDDCHDEQCLGTIV